MSSSSTVSSSLDSLEARMAAFRARAKSSQPASSSSSTPRTGVMTTPTKGTKQEESKTTASGSPVIGVPVSTEVDAFITPISKANVLPSTSSTSASTAGATSNSALAARRDSVRVSNISRHDNGWSPSSSPEPATLAGVEVEDASRSQNADGQKNGHARKPSGSPVGSGLVLSYKSDGESTSKRPLSSSASSASSSTHHPGTWAEAQAAQQAKDSALASARRRREEQREARERDRAKAEATKLEADGATQSPLTARSAAAASSGSGYASFSSPLTARSRAAQEERTSSGYIVPASDSREVLGALKKKAAAASLSASGGITPRTGPGGAGGGATARGTARTMDPRSKGFDPSSLDYEDSNGAYAAAAFLPMSARGPGAGPPLPNSARGSSTARGLLSPGTQSAVDRRRELLARKEKVRQKKAAALAAITAASTPVEQGGTLILDHNGQPAKNQMRTEGQGEGQTNGTGGGGPMPPRGCEMLDFKGVGEKSCVIQ